ncbi:MAG: hypothetical protein V1689_05435 [Pseudomonadota bacterium]
MSIEKIRELVHSIEPEEAISALAIVVKNQLSLLEEEVASSVRNMDSLEPAEVAKRLGLSHSGAKPLITKLKKEGKLHGEDR